MNGNRGLRAFFKGYRLLKWFEVRKCFKPAETADEVALLTFEGAIP